MWLLVVRGLLTLVLRLVELEVGQAHRRRRRHLLFLLVVEGSASLHLHAAGGMVSLAVRRCR